MLPCFWKIAIIRWSATERRGAPLPSKFSLAKLSFRWQVGLLGTLVVFLSLAVLFAIAATLRYTKSAVLGSEKVASRRLLGILRMNTKDRANSARHNNQETPLDHPDSGSSQEFLALMIVCVAESG